MQEAWIPLACPNCGERWEDNPAELPTPGSEFECRSCGERRSVAEFVATKEGYDVLTEFHGE